MATFGAATNLVAGTMTLTLPALSKYWGIDNQSGVPLTVTFIGDTNGTFGPKILNPHPSGAGYTGDVIDSILYPWFGTSVTITGTGTAQFSSCSTTTRPGVEVL